MNFEDKHLHLRDIILNDAPRTHLERFLDTQAAVALNKTCREFRRIPFPYNTINNEPFNLYKIDVRAALAPIKDRIRALKARLDLRTGPKDLVPPIDRQLQFLTPNLRELNLELPVVVNGRQFLGRPEQFSRLSGPLASLTGLERLTIICDSYYQQRDRHAIQGIDVIGKLSLDLSRYKQLRELRLCSVAVEPATPSPWSDLQGLEELTLYNTTGVPLSEAALADMRRLTSLSLTNMDAQKQPVLRGSQIAAASALRELTLIGSNFRSARSGRAVVNDDTLDQLTKLSGLQFVHLDSYQISMDLSPISGLTQLTRLVLTNPTPPLHPQPRRDRRVCAALGFPGLTRISGKYRLN
jgi:hypothetical protein